MLTRLAVALLWVLHWLPLPLLAGVGCGLGEVLYLAGRSRRHVVLTNLRLCFPELDEARRRRLARAHFRLVARSFLERGILWWASPRRIRRLVRIGGHERAWALVAEGKPLIFLAPHFVGLDTGGTRLAMESDFVSIYARQKNPLVDRLLRHGRSRFGNQLLLSRQDGVRATVKAMRAGRPFYYLPDMDYGARDAIFVPFLGVPAATITGLPRLARLAGAAVVPCVTRVLPWGRGYTVDIGEPWTDYPTDNLEADVIRMNAFIESVVREIPAQYYWVHRRFKTRPPGEATLY